MELRRKDRQITDQQLIQKLLSQAKILHLGLLDEGYPYVVPLFYGFEYQSETDSYVFYAHCAKEGHKLNLLYANPNAFVQIDTGATLIEGDDTPCTYSAYYTSFMGRAQAALVTDMQEKKRALTILMQNMTSRDFTFTDEMAAGVAVLRFCVPCYTAKARLKPNQP